MYSGLGFNGSAVTRRIRQSMPTTFNDLDGTSMKDTRLLFKPEGSMDADDAYTALGAAIFMAMESYHEQKYNSNITNLRKNLITQLLQSVNQVRDVNKFRADTTKLLVDYESAIREAIKNDVTPDSTVELWTYWGSLLREHLSRNGYRACIDDRVCECGDPPGALIAGGTGESVHPGSQVPVGLRKEVTKSDLKKKRSPSTPALVEQAHVEAGETGSLKAKSLQSLDDEAAAAAAGQRCRSSSKVVYGYEVEDEFNLPISIAIGILFVYIMLGATMYTIWEDWTFIEVFFFVFVSLSTIGFGDVLPAHQNMFVGLSLVSMCINVAVEFFHSMSKRAKQKMGEAKRKIGDKYQASKNAREKISGMKHK
ncbi:TWK18-like protein [Mya arenaria]|uniref:TWK18-like protein n=1 Tax=Mya arenaria TaxID=6604 RepID=A0ABY7FPC3_MYAAR|nr:TWK18-like protein [Mya arenaria]